MPLTKESVRESLARVRHPIAGADLVAAAAVRKVAVCDGMVSVVIAAGGVAPGARGALKEQIERAVRTDAGGDLVELHVELVDEPVNPGAPASAPAAPPRSAHGAHAPAQSQATALPGVRHVIAVGAGKGGVGKSTIAVCLAVGLARRGHAVGLMDGDIYGPSIPTMLGLSAMEPVVIGPMIQPFFVHGVKAMTIGKLVEPDRPLIWRGPMAHGAFKQLVEQTQWGELDFLVIDLPPGTGDVALTMAQLLKLTGAVVVCTPQKVAQDDAVRAAKMFQQLGIEVLGVVENMSYFIGDDGKEYDIFGRGGAEKMAARLNVPFLGAVPINMALRENSDSGKATANFTDTSARGKQLARDLEAMVEATERQAALAAGKSRAPTLSVS
jgi:ATP-binding protein involved in chromosome partitioning